MKKTLLAIAAAAALSLTVSGCSDSSASSLRYNATLDQASQAEKAAVLQTLQELVNIETGTNDAVGIPQMGN
jgi:glutamate carboxypeptidase